MIIFFSTGNNITWTWNGDFAHERILWAWYPIYFLAYKNTFQSLVQPKAKMRSAFIISLKHLQYI